MTKNIKEEKEPKKKKTISLGILVVSVILIWLGTFVGIMELIPEWQERGQFGDLFGSVNALFSGFAFAGILYTISLQRHELSLQKEELKLQRDEMAASRAELAAQVKAQNAMHLTNIKQISITAKLAKIESLKVKVTSQKALYSNSNLVDDIASQIQKIADEIDKTSKELYDEQINDLA